MEPSTWATIVVASRLALGLFFLSTAWGKRGHAPAVADSMRAMGLFPPAAVPWIMRSLPWVEGIPALLLLLGWAVPPAAALLALLLVGFNVVIAISLRRGRVMPCGCSGLAGHHRISWGLVGRNMLLLLVALLLVVQAPLVATWTAWTEQWQADLALLRDPAALVLLLVLPVSLYLLGELLLAVPLRAERTTESSAEVSR